MCSLRLPSLESLRSEEEIDHSRVPRVAQGFPLGGVSSVSRCFASGSGLRSSLSRESSRLSLDHGLKDAHGSMAPCGIWRSSVGGAVRVRSPVFKNQEDRSPAGVVVAGSLPVHPLLVRGEDVHLRILLHADPVPGEERRGLPSRFSLAGPRISFYASQGSPHHAARRNDSRRCLAGSCR